LTGVFCRYAQSAAVQSQAQNIHFGAAQQDDMLYRPGRAMVSARLALGGKARMMVLWTAPGQRWRCSRVGTKQRPLQAGKEDR
jgi:hypothetical protein